MRDSARFPSEIYVMADRAEPTRHRLAIVCGVETDDRLPAGKTAPRRRNTRKTKHFGGAARANARPLRPARQAPESLTVNSYPLVGQLRLLM